MYVLTVLTLRSLSYLIHINKKGFNIMCNRDISQRVCFIDDEEDHEC